MSQDGEGGQLVSACCSPDQSSAECTRYLTRIAGLGAFRSDHQSGWGGGYHFNEGLEGGKERKERREEEETDGDSAVCITIGSSAGESLSSRNTPALEKKMVDLVRQVD